jgi:hypothetical protein
MEGDGPLQEQEKYMNLDGIELSLDDLEKVSGSFKVGGIPCPRPRLPIPHYGGPHSGASGSTGDGDTQLGSDSGGGDSGGGSGGYKGDDNYLREF